MRRFSSLFAAILLCAVASGTATAAEEPAALAGTWTLNNWTPGSSAHLTLSYRSGTTRWEWGSDQALADLRGLASDQLHAAHASVEFTLQRDAGAFGFEGTMVLGIGRGEFRFIPDPRYAAALASLGYGPVEDDNVSLMLMAVRDISLAYAEEVRRSGLEGVTAADLVRFQDHGVSLPMIRAAADMGPATFTADDVVRFRDHGIDEGFLRALKASAPPALTAEGIVRLRDHGVGPEYLARVRASYPDLTLDQVIKLYEHGID
jgi:hypothetical protein